MKKDIHPDYHTIKVITASGEEFETCACYGKEGEVLRLDVDPSTHPAWTGGAQRIVDTGGRLARFNKRFGDLGGSSS